MIRGAMGRWAAFGLLVLGATGASVAAEDEQVTRGREIAQIACVECHAVGRTGDSPKELAPRFRELGRKYPVESLEESLAEGVLVGHPGMPEVKMNERDIGAFIAYLKTIQVP